MHRTESQLSVGDRNHFHDPRGALQAERVEPAPSREGTVARPALKGEAVIAFAADEVREFHVLIRQIDPDQRIHA